MTDRPKRQPQNHRCVCVPAEGVCHGVPGETETCAPCLVLDPEHPCLRDPEAWDGGDDDWPDE